MERIHASLPIDFNPKALDSLTWGEASTMKGGLAMARKLEITDYGDAINETRQWSPIVTAIDNAGQFGHWY